MSQNSWEQALQGAQVDGAALTNTVTPTSILPAAARFNFPSNIDQVGTMFRLKAWGKYSTKSATPGTLTFDFRVGSVIVANMGASPTLQTSKSNAAWVLDMDLTVRSIGGGTSATIEGAGKWDTGGSDSYLMVPAVGTGFDSTASGFMDLFGTWSVADPSNSIILNEYKIELLN